jgi:hypothetical protein
VHRLLKRWECLGQAMRSWFWGNLLLISGLRLLVRQLSQGSSRINQMLNKMLDPYVGKNVGMKIKSILSY